MLVSWGKRCQGDKARRRTPSERTTVTGIKSPVRAVAKPPVTAGTVRESLRAFARGSPQVLVKINSFSKDGADGLASLLQ